MFGRTAPRWFVGLLAAHMSLMRISVHLAAEDWPTWVTGAAFERQRSAVVGIDWSGVPFRQAVQKLARTQKIAVWLDRRLDPDQSIEFSASGVSLEVALLQLAQHQKIGVCYIQDVAYLGPASLTEKLPTVAALRREEAARQPDRLRRQLFQSRPVRWPELSAPRDMLQLMAKKSGVELIGLDQVPHDLWPEIDLPALPLIDHMTLVAAGFDLTFEFDPTGQTIALVPIPASVRMVRSYPIPATARDAAQQLRQKFPDIRTAVRANRVEVDGIWEQHELVTRFLRGETVERRTVTAGESRFSLRVQEQPAGSVIRTLRDRLKLQVTIEAGADMALKKLISFEVSEGTLDDVLHATLDPLGLGYRLREQQLTIHPGRQP